MNNRARCYGHWNALAPFSWEQAELYIAERHNTVTFADLERLFHETSVLRYGRTVSEMRRTCRKSGLLKKERRTRASPTWWRQIRMVQSLTALCSKYKIKNIVLYKSGVICNRLLKLLIICRPVSPPEFGKLQWSARATAVLMLAVGDWYNLTVRTEFLFAAWRRTLKFVLDNVQWAWRLEHSAVNVAKFIEFEE